MARIHLVSVDTDGGEVGIGPVRFVRAGGNGRHVEVVLRGSATLDVDEWSDLVATATTVCRLLRRKEADAAFDADAKGGKVDR